MLTLPARRHPAGREALARRQRLLRRRHGPRRRLEGRRARRSACIGFIPTGAGTHGLYASRDATLPLHHQPRRGHRSRCSASRPGKRRRRSGGSPAAAARTWATSRPTARCSGCQAAGTASSMRSTPAAGRLLAKIPVGASPHGLCVWPQPGRYSLGHTGHPALASWRSRGRGRRRGSGRAARARRASPGRRRRAGRRPWRRRRPRGSWRRRR